MGPMLGQWPELTYFFGQLISTFRCFAVSLVPKHQRETSFFFLFKVTVPITCAAVKSSCSKLLCLIIHFWKKNNPASLFKSLLFQCNQICPCSPSYPVYLCLSCVYPASPSYPFLYFKNIYPSPSSPEYSQFFVDLAFFKPLSQSLWVFAVSPRPWSDYNCILLSKAN